MQTVESEAIRGIGYREANRELIVRFVDGGLYAYKGVAPAVHRDFLAAPSKGRFFHERVLGRYPYRRLA